MKTLRAYTGTCQCGNERMTLTSDGRTNCVNRKCLACGNVVVLWRDPDLDRPLKPMIPEITPPLDCSHEDLVAYIRSMKGGERVQEMGSSCMTGQKGTVEIKNGDVLIRWDRREYADGAGVMVTSFTGGARIIPDANSDPADT